MLMLMLMIMLMIMMWVNNEPIVSRFFQCLTSMWIWVGMRMRRTRTSSSRVVSAAAAGTGGGGSLLVFLLKCSALQLQNPRKRVREGRNMLRFGGVFVLKFCSWWLWLTRLGFTRFLDSLIQSRYLSLGHCVCTRQVPRPTSCGSLTSLGSGNLPMCGVYLLWRSRTTALLSSYLVMDNLKICFSHFIF